MTYRQRKERKRRGKGRIGRRLLLAFAVVVTVALIGAASVVGYIASIAASAPDINDLKPIDKGSVSEIFAADGSRLGYVQSSEIRTPIAWDDMPIALRQATVAIEDKRFYEHHGVDYEGVIRAGWKNLTSGKTVQGGSTITQQLVRALYIKDPKRDFKRKIREPYFFDYVQDQLIQRYGVGVYRKGGLKVYTTIDPKLQKEGRAAIQGRLYLKSDPSSAIVSIDPDTGYIKAMASSGGYRDRTFNLAAQGHRQPGSSFKPFVLITAVLQGADPDRTIYVSKPVHLDLPGYGVC